MGAAIAYEDWLIGGATLAASMPDEWTPIGDTPALFTPQLSDCAGFLRAEGTELGAWTVDRSIGGAREIEHVSLLDFRHSGGSYLVEVYVLPLTGDPSLIYEGLSYGGYPSSDFVRHINIILPNPITATGIRVVVTVATSTLETQVTIGRLWAGPLWQAPNGIFRSWETGIRDPGDVSRSRGGQGYARDEQRIRTLRMELSHVNFEGAFGNPLNSVLDLQQLGMRAGTTSPLIAFPRTEDEHSIHRLGIYGHLTEGLRIRHGGGDQFNAAFEVVELL